MTSHFKKMHHQLSICQVSQGLLTRIVDQNSPQKVKCMILKVCCKVKKDSVAKFSSTQCNKSARVVFDKAVDLLSTLCSGEVHCNQTEYDSWRKGLITFLWVKQKISADVTDTLMEKKIWGMGLTLLSGGLACFWLCGSLDSLLPFSRWITDFELFVSNLVKRFEHHWIKRYINAVCMY